MPLFRNRSPVRLGHGIVGRPGALVFGQSAAVLGHGVGQGRCRQRVFMHSSAAWAPKSRRTEQRSMPPATRRNGYLVEQSSCANRCPAGRLHTKQSGSIAKAVSFWLRPRPRPDARGVLARAPGRAAADCSAADSSCDAVRASCDGRYCARQTSVAARRGPAPPLAAESDTAPPPTSRRPLAAKQMHSHACVSAPSRTPCGIKHFDLADISVRVGVELNPRLVGGATGSSCTALFGDVDHTGRAADTERGDRRRDFHVAGLGDQGWRQTRPSRPRH